MDIRNYEALQNEIKLTKDMKLSITNVWQFFTDASLTRDQSVINLEARPHYNSAMAAILGIIKEEEESSHIPVLKQIAKDLEEMYDTGQRMFNAYSEDWDQGNVLMKEFDVISKRVLDSATVYAANEEAKGHAAIEEMMAMVNAATAATTFLFILTAVVSCGAIATIILLKK